MPDKYKIIEKIYQSRITEVFRAIRETDGLPVILKVRSELIPDESESGPRREFELGKTLVGAYSVEHLALERES